MWRKRRLRGSSLRADLMEGGRRTEIDERAALRRRSTGGFGGASPDSAGVGLGRVRGGAEDLKREEEEGAAREATPVGEGAAARKALPVEEGPPRVGSKAQGGRCGRGGFGASGDGRGRCRQAGRRRGRQEAPQWG